MKNNSFSVHQGESITEILFLLDSRLGKSTYTCEVSFSCNIILSPFGIQNSIKLIEIASTDGIAACFTFRHYHAAFGAMCSHYVNLAPGLMNVEAKLIVAQGMKDIRH